MNTKYYILKVDNMINEGIQQGKYEWTNDRTHEVMEKFQQFVYRSLKNDPKDSDMTPVSNQPARFSAIAKSHKFDVHFLINLDDLKFRPIIDQSNTYSYNAANKVSDYLQPLAHNDYVIKDILTFAEIIKKDVLNRKEEYASCDTESLNLSLSLN